MDRALLHFLNHGLLPFTGRSAEIERIEAFWRETLHASGLRAMLITGEAGIGKSRLIEEVTGRIAAAGGVIVQIRLYPDSTASIVPMLAGALARSATAQDVLRSDPEETLQGVVSALLRLCGLRPTLLVIEDFHLLPTEALGDVASLLDRLSDEPISLLLAARPIDLTGRSLLERYLVDEVELTGLPDADVALLCRSVLGDETVDDRIITTLREKTLGNTLALRSALRGAIRSGLAPTGRASGTTRPGIDRRAFLNALERNVRLLSEGMAAHLSEEEKKNAARLATLGEVFAIETASMLLGNAASVIEVLTFKGILHTPVSPPDSFSAAKSENAPLAFTHNLLHRYFVETANVDADAILRLVAANPPLYSILPFQFLISHVDEVTPDPETVTEAFNKTLKTTFRLDDTSDWKFTATIVSAATALFERIEEKLEPEIWRQMKTRLISHQLNIQRREPNSDYEPLVMQFASLTDSPPDAMWAELRMTALVYLRRYHRNHGSGQIAELWEEVRTLIRRYPKLGYSRPYAGFLRDTVREAIVGRDRRTWRQVEESLREILESPDASETNRLVAWRLLSPYMLTLFDNEEELQQRFRLLEDLERDESMSADRLIWKIGLLVNTGRFSEGLEAITRSLPVFQERGLKLEVVSCRHLALYIRAISGEPFDDIGEETLRVCETAPERMRQKFRVNAAMLLTAAALLRNDAAAAVRILERFSVDRSNLPDERHILIALAEQDMQGLVLRTPEENPAPLTSLARIVSEHSRITPDRALSLAEAISTMPLLGTDDALRIRAAIDLLIRAVETPPEIRAVIRTVIERMLGWLAERGMTEVMTAMVAQYTGILPKNEATAWRSRIATIVRQQESRGGEEPRVKISLFGAITVQQPGEDPVRIRGAQLCTLLGLMSANAILARPLSTREFTSLAIGLERDPDKVRKSLNFAVFRLRESIGSDSIDTAGETPVLNLSVVSVDLIDAHRHLRAAAEAVSDGALLRAVPELLAALRISRGEVPFPTLYDEFFESAREDFENELRSTLIRAARALLRHEDAASAEELLDLAFSAMPDDEEVAEMLRQALTSLGKRTEATRVGMRVAEAMDE